jgi:hypothetical protein
MALLVAGSFAITVLLLVVCVAVRADRQARHWRGGDERRMAERRFVQALEVQDFDRAEDELRLLLGRR